MNEHVHTRGDEYRVFWIPADVDIPMEMKVIATDWRSMASLVGGYIEVLRSDSIPELYCGCHMVMVVNEEGRLHALPENHRASILANKPRPILGDVFVIGEGMVDIPDEGQDVDFFSLPPALVDWAGPGSPLPAQPESIGR